VALTGTSLRNRNMSAIISALPGKGALYQTPDGIPKCGSEFERDGHRDAFACAFVRAGAITPRLRTFAYRA